MASFNIIFDKESRKYIAGETVNCKVQVTVHKTFKAWSLTLRCAGKAKTEWRIGRYTDYDAEEEYFRFQKCLQGTDIGDPVDVLPGDYEYQASFTLPSDLPSSIQHDYGRIYCSMTANYNVEKWFDKSKKEYFTVAAQVNLNDFPELAESVKHTEERIFKCLWSKTDPMQLILNLPKLGYIPGELIPITIEVNNNSNVTVKAVQVKLKEKITFITKNPKEDFKYKKSTLKEHTFDGTVAQFQNKIFQTDFLLDPAYDWKLFTKCGIILCDYIIKVKAKTSGCHRNTSFEKKITIGTTREAPMVKN